MASKKKSEVSVDDAPVSYEILAGIPVPPKRRGPVEVFPFGQLEVGQSFFVPGADQKLAGTVATAQRRYAVVSDTETRTNRKGETVAKLVPTRQFQLFVVAEGYTYPNGYVEQASGARIFRTA